MVPGERDLRKIWWACIHRATLDYFNCNDLPHGEAIAAQHSAEIWFFRADQDAINSFENIMIMLGDDPARWRKKLLLFETKEVTSRKYLNRWHPQAKTNVITRQDRSG